MTQAYTDPVKLREFSNQLNSFADNIEHVMDLLKGAMGRLQETWRDQEFMKFAQEYRSAQELLNRFVQETRKTTPRLDKDAEAIEEYQRYNM